MNYASVNSTCAQPQPPLPHGLSVPGVGHLQFCAAGWAQLELTDVLILKAEFHLSQLLNNCIAMRKLSA